MSEAKKNAQQCLLPSELSPKQLDALSFVPGVLSNFDEKEKLPPTARAQWTYVQLNPIDFLNRFTNELGLLGVNVAICFINKEPYEDHEKELKTPITVNLIVQPEQISDIAIHLQSTNLSHQILEDDRGFALPYLGSIQKTVDALALEKFVSFMFIKNSISREAYSTWISVPRKYLDVKKPKKAKTKKAKKGSTLPTQEVSQEAVAQSEPAAAPPPKEDFNYVIYDDTGETAPPVIPQPEDQKPQSVVVQQPEKPKKKSAFSKFSDRLGKKEAKPKKEKAPACPMAKFDAALFTFLALFNLHCSILLLNFLGTSLEAFVSVMVEATTVAAFVSLLFTILVIRPSFRIKQNRVWSLLAYVCYAGVAGYQILSSSSFSGTPNYLVPGALSFVFIMGATISAFLRIDRMSTKKAKASDQETEEEDTEDSVEIEIESAATQESVKAPKSVDLPKPTRAKAKKEETKKIELKPSSKTAVQPDESEPAQPVAPVKAEPDQKPAKKLASKKTIPTTPISEEQKEAIRTRLSRKETLSTPSPSAPNTQDEPAPSTADEQKPLSTAEIKARLAERLQQARATNSGLNKAEKPEAEKEEATPVEEAADNAQEDAKDKKSIQLRKSSGGGSNERTNKLSLPNS